MRIGLMSGATPGPDGTLDGIVARAYPTGRLRGRELVHDWWHGIPVLVDW